MAFDGLNLNSFSDVQSSAATKGMSNLPMLERKARSRLLANEYQNQQAIEAAKLGYQSQLDAFKPKETSWGDIAMGVAGSAAQAGLFSGGGNQFSGLFSGGGNQFSGRGSSGTDSFGRDFDDPWATSNNTGLIQDPFGMDSTYGGATTEWNTDMPIPSSGGNAWYNPFGWK